MWQVLETQKAEIQAQVKALGPLQDLQLLSRGGSDGARTFRYRAVFTHGRVIMALTLDRDGRIAGLQNSNED